MKERGASRPDGATWVGVPLTIAVVLLAQIFEGGRLRTLVQPTAGLVVFGGTIAALLVSYPLPTLGRALAAVRQAFRTAPAPTTAIVSQFTQYSIRARRKGIMSLEADIARAADPFLARALTLAVDGFSPVDVKSSLELDNRTREDADEDAAQVLEAAAGYAPTLGILGAVLGLIHVMDNLAAPSRLGSGIAVAFVATIYGVGSANLIFLPLATKLRALARAAALQREIVIEGIAAIQGNVHPRLVEQHLSAYVRVRVEQGGAARAAA